MTHEYFVLMHPDGLGQSWSDIDKMPEWEREEYLRLLEQHQDKQQHDADKTGSGKSRPSRARFTKG